MSWTVWVAVALLGSVGALARFAIDGLISARDSGRLPLGTLVVNGSGALLLGLVTGLTLTGDALLLVGSATLGSYTTFSTWMLETERLNEHGHGRVALTNVLVSVALGIGAVAFGRTLGGWL